jgi:hypothetical protein
MWVQFAAHLSHHMERKCCYNNDGLESGPNPAIAALVTLVGVDEFRFAVDGDAPLDSAPTEARRPGRATSRGASNTKILLHQRLSCGLKSPKLKSIRGATVIDNQHLGMRPHAAGPIASRCVLDSEP